MRNWAQSWLGHIFLGMIALDHLIERIWPACEKCKEFGQFIERRISERRHTTMSTPFADKVNAAFKIVNIGLADAPKLIADIAACEASGKDPVAETAALGQLLADAQPAIDALIALVPQPTVTATTTTPPPAAA